MRRPVSFQRKEYINNLDVELFLGCLNGITETTKWYKQLPEAVTENETCKVLWDDKKEPTAF